MTTFNCLNPDNEEVILQSKEWVHPSQPNFKQENKQNVKTIVQMNRDRVKNMKVERIIEGKQIPSSFCPSFFNCYLFTLPRAQAALQDGKVYQGSCEDHSSRVGEQRD